MELCRNYVREDVLDDDIDDEQHGEQAARGPTECAAADKERGIIHSDDSSLTSSLSELADDWGSSFCSGAMATVFLLQWRLPVWRPVLHATQNRVGRVYRVYHIHKSTRVQPPFHPAVEGGG